MRKKVLIISFSVAAICFITSIILLLNKHELPKLFKGTYEVEVFEYKTISDFTNDPIDTIVNTNKVGKQTFEYEYNDELVSLEINVVDKTPPYIGIGDYYNHIKDTNFTFEKDVICKDNYDKTTKCEIIGEYKIDELGESNVSVRATDSSGNVTEKDFIIRVIEKSSINNDTKTISLEEANSKKPQDTVVMIDVSKWQKDIDWEKVKESGIDYAMIRLGTQEAIDKGSVLDAYFDQNIKGAQKAGIKVGVYYFSYAHTINDAKEQAKWVIEQLKDYKLDLPISFDWECWNFINGFEMSLHDLNEIADTFLSTLKKEGYKVMNYGSKSKLINIWTLEDYPVWLAHYTESTDYEGKYIAWQFTDVGRVNGVNSNVDLSYLNVKLLEE